jgi:hypothetical protein
MGHDGLDKKHLFLEIHAGDEAVLGLDAAGYSRGNVGMKADVAGLKARSTRRLSACATGSATVSRLS